MKYQEGMTDLLRQGYSAYVYDHTEHAEVQLDGPTRGWADEACTASDQMIDQARKGITPVLVLQAGFKKCFCSKMP